jgi:hypothetical protein
MTNRELPGKLVPTRGPVMMKRELSGESGSLLTSSVSRKSRAARLLPPLKGENKAGSMLVTAVDRVLRSISRKRL